MIVIGADVQNLALDNLPVNWFDVAVLGLLVLGFFRGRKRGMSKEFLLVLKWVTLVVVCGLWYSLAAQLLVNSASLGRMSSAIFGYLLMALAIWLVFRTIKWFVAGRMADNNNLFGGGEYYLGMVAGMIRFFCMLLAVLALLNAPYYTAADIKQHDAYVKRWFGGGMYSGDYFPSLASIQEQVFNKSFTGPYIKEYLGFLLIETTPPADVKMETKPKPAVVNIKK
jgi:uncharacterized membrane protein required for colicin V production